MTSTHDRDRKSMTESQQTICTWADSTFGPASDASIAARALVEMAELVTACVNGEPAERIGEEIADVVIVLARLGRCVAIDVLATASYGGVHADRAIWNAAIATESLASTLSALASDDLLAAAERLHRTSGDLGFLARDLSINLLAAIDRKMAINRARRWVIDEHGHGQHVKDGQ